MYLLVVAGLTVASSWNLSGPAPHLIFHYLPWYTAHEAVSSHSAWEQWSYSGPGIPRDPIKRRPDGLRDIAAKFYPLIGPYSSSSRSVVRYHMQTIKAAGGEAIAVDWYGPESHSGLRMPLILDEAQNAGLKVTVCYEEKMNFIWPSFRNPKTRAEAVDRVTDDFTYILANYAKNRAWLRRKGRPFWFQFNGWGEGAVGRQYLSGEEWKQVFSRLPEKIEYGRQGLETEYDSPSVARYLWFSSDANATRSFAGGTHERVIGGKASFYMSCLSPGFDDSGVSGWGGKSRIWPRKGLSTLYGTFRSSLSGPPELIQVVTFNDHNEGTVVEPTREMGYQYVDALATWWSELRGKKPDLAAIRKPFFEYVKTCSKDEQSELPPKPWDALLKKRSLKVGDPMYLEGTKTPGGY